MILSISKENFKFVTTVLKNFGLRPNEPSVAVAVAEGAKSSATAVEIRPSVDPWPQLMIEIHESKPNMYSYPCFDPKSEVLAKVDQN